MNELDILLSGIQFLAALSAAWIALIAWQQRAQPGSLPLAFLMIAVMVWGIGAGAIPFALPERQIFWHALEILGAGLASTLYLIFIIEYARQEKLIRRKITYLLWLVPVASAILAYTNPRHFLFWKHPEIGGISLFVAFLVYYYSLRLIATTILARAILRLPPGSHAQAWVFTLGALTPWLSNIVYAIIAPAEQFSSTSLEFHPIAYALSGLILGWGILRYRLLDVVPLARDLAMEHLRDAIITLDLQNRIIDLNPAAETLLGTTRKTCFGHALGDVLPTNHPLREIILNRAISQQVHIPHPFDQYYDVETIPVTDKQSQLRGWLVVLHDTTARNKAEQDLLQSQQTLDNILKTAPFALAITSLEGGEILYINSVTRELFEMENKPLHHFRSAAFYDEPHLRPLIIETIRETGKIDSIELRMRTANKNQRWVLASMRRMTYQGKDAILVAMTDISERKKMTDELERSRAQLKVIFDFAGLGIRVTDRYGRYQFVNEQWANMLGLTPEALLGQEEWMFLHPNHVPFNREQHRALIQREIEQYRLENRYLTAQGECFWGEITVSPTLTPMGEVESTIGFILDISKRKQAELALRETERRFREILEHIQLLAVMLDAEGNLTFCNAHFLEVTGWERDEILGRNWLNLTGNSDESAMRALARAIQRGSILSRNESLLTTRRNEKLVISWTNITLKDESGQNIGLASLGLDITERRRAHEAEREQRLLAEALTHTAEALTSSLEFEQILQRILEHVGQVVPHDAANIALIEGDHVIYAGMKGYEKYGVQLEDVKALKFKFREVYNLRQMYRTKQPVVTPNTVDDPHWVRVPEAAWIQSHVGAPITVQNKVVGFLNLDSATPNFFNQEHARRLAAFSAQAAIAIENARLFEKVKRALLERRKAQQNLRRANKRLESKIAEIEKLQRKLREQAIRDPLTGLYNRRFMDETLAREIARAQRDDLPISIMMLDIDHFKKVNDTYGHEAGDLMLKTLANILLRESRRSDIPCRYGGEEFCVIMIGAPLPIALQRAEAWRKQFCQTVVLYKHQPLQATISIGVAVFPEHGVKAETILRAADEALYIAKQSGRNRVIEATPV
ncbi:MAG: PAS domain S-box protein [Anaerolineales bacterium]|nr:PAS domain S-box protein [Anaerolineales bacterium]MCX7756607.1 PAS domain S-box protein [Anaerolineales bacterium]MDW8277865.1 PAS domain S-box protein [Anaerolineales bacterium]